MDRGTYWPTVHGVTEWDTTEQLALGTMPGSQGSKYVLGSFPLTSPRDFTFTRQPIIAEDLFPNKPGKWISFKRIKRLE